MRAATLAPAIAALLATTTDPGARLLGDTLADWPGDYSLESLAPVLFETFMAFWQERIAAQWLPPHLVATARARGRIAERSLIEPGYSPLDGDLPALVAETATRAVAAIRGRHGDDPAGWRWGRVHLVHLRHPLSTPSTADCFDLGPAPIPGSFETLFNTGLGTPPGCESVSGVEYRLIADFAHPHEILAIQNAGNSGQPGSPHYADQFQPWIDGDFHRLSLTGPLAIVGKTTLEPDR